MSDKLSQEQLDKLFSALHDKEMARLRQTNIELREAIEKCDTHMRMTYDKRVSKERGNSQPS